MLDFNLLDDMGTESFDIEEVTDQDIAIIGLAAQLPLVENLEEFWKFLTGGVDFVSPLPENRRKDVEAFARPGKTDGERPVFFEGSYLDRIDAFDYSFFRLSPQEASLMTPNQRLFLQVAWQAIEDAGYCRTTLAGSRTGVFVGFNADSLFDYKRMVADVDPALLSLAVPGNISSVIAGRISYLLDLNGPSLCVDTACSSSMVAVHLACQSIRNRECEMALAGSVKINLLPLANEVKIGIESSSGRARSFDDSADGTTAGEGVVAFVLKPLSKALRDGDAIHAVIKGSAINQDGNSVGLTAPNVAAQEDVLVRAWENAGIHPDTIGYMEAHGTGTKLGDPIEIAGMDRAFRRFTNRKQFVALGSVKANVGHLDHAAGAMGILKAVLALKHKALPPLIHFERPNRSIDFIDSPVYVNDRLAPWPDNGHPRRCGISSFGMSGTNGHLVLEEAPESGQTGGQPEESSSRQGNLLTISAKTEPALRELAHRYAQLDWKAINIANACYTAHTGRDHHAYRLAIPFEGTEELQGKLHRLRADNWKELGQQGIYYGHRKHANAEAGQSERDGEGLSWDEIGRSYARGEDFNWSRLYDGQELTKERLPTYPFESHRCWLAMPRQEAGDTFAEGVEPRVAIVSVDGGTSEPTATELAIAEIWGETLGFGQLRLEDDFFELGGDSILALKIANRIQSRFGVEFAVSDLFKVAVLRDLAALVDERRANGSTAAFAAVEPLLAQGKREVYPLTSSQYRIFAQEQLGELGTMNNTPFCVMVDGELDADRAEEAFRQLIRRHESLRTSFAFVEGMAVQRIAEQVEFAVERHRAEPDQLDAVIDAFVRPFALDRPPLLRVGFVQLGASRHLMMIDMHHICSDGMSAGLLMEEFGELYEGRSLPDLAVHYKDYAVWLQQQLSTGKLDASRAYWRDRLAGELPALSLPYDYPRPERKLPRGKRLRAELPAALTRGLERLAADRKLTMNALLFALYALWLHKYANEDRFYIGTVVAGRNHPDLEKVFGMFINYLPIESRFEPNTTFLDFLAGTNATLGEAFAHDYPFDLMLQEARVKTERSRNPVYDAMFIYHNEYKMNAAHPHRMKLDGITIAEYPLDRAVSALDLKLDVWPDKEGRLALILEYDEALFRESTLRSWLTAFERLAESAVSNPQARLVGLLTAADSLLESAALNGPEEPGLLESAAASDAAVLEAVISDASAGFELAISATFTADPIGRYIDWWCRQFDLPVHVSFAPYHQTFRDLADPDSLLSANKGANLLLVRFEDWIRDDDSPVADKIAKLNGIGADLRRLFADRKSAAPYFIGLLPVSESARAKYDKALVACLELLHESWKQFVVGLDRVFAIPLDETIAEAYQVAQMEDPITDREGHLPFTEPYQAVIGTAVARRLVAWKRQTYKIVVLDCDNTLWRGVCGEDGATGVVVSEAFEKLQRFMLARYEEGMLLAICSKNNEADVWETFARNPGMVLKKEHFVAARIGWGSKAKAVRELAEQLNVGLDSFVFVDDSGLECAEMIRSCPSVLTLRLPEDERDIPMFLSHAWAFDKLIVTEEDRRRTAMYAAETLRRQYMQEEDTSLESFLRGLELRIVVARLHEEQLQRAVQLAQRTNQFNLNGIRRSEADLRNALSSPDSQLWGITVEDRFGTYGLVGLMAGSRAGDDFAIHTFLLSCRVLGRGVETAMLSEAVAYAHSRGFGSVSFDYVETDKNAPLRAYLESLRGTGCLVDDRATDRFVVNATRIPELPAHATVETEWPISPVPTVEREHSVEASAAPIPPVVRASRLSDVKETGQRTWQMAEGAIPEGEALPGDRYLRPLMLHAADLIVRYANQVNRADAVASNAPAMDQEQLSATETTLAALWEQALHTRQFGVQDSFFDIGGNSLQAVSLASAIHRQFHAEVTLRDLFAVPTIRGLAALIDRSKPSVYEPISPVQARHAYPVTSAQKRLLVLHLMEGRQSPETSDTAYNQPAIFEVEGALNVAKLQSACEELCRRHEILRTRFVWEDDDFVQIIDDSAKLEIYCHELDSGETDIDTHIEKFIQPFDLSSPPLFRVGVLRLTDTSWILMLDTHHIAADGVSVSIMLDDLLAIYQEQELPALRIQFRDYAVWQAESMASDKMLAHERYWLDQFEDEVPALQLPLDAPRAAVRGYEGSSVGMPLDVDLTEAVTAFAADIGATPYMVYLAAYYLLLAKYAGQEDIVVGSPIAGRAHPDLNGLIGMFVHTVALRGKPEGGKTFRQFVVEVKENVLAAMEHGDYPFEELVDRLGLRRDLSRHPLFDTMFAYQNMSWSGGDTEGLKFRYRPHPPRRSRFDLTLVLAEQGGAVEMSAEYATGIFAEETVKRLLRHFANIVAQAVREPNRQLSRIDMLDESDKAKLLFGFNATQAAFEADATMQGLFEQRAAQAPDAIAIVHGERTLTYAELNGRANRLARHLREQGAKRNTLVAIAVDRSPEMIVAALAVLKSGSAYLPIDPEYPAERIHYMLDDSKAQFAIVQRRLADRMPEGLRLTLVDEGEFAYERAHDRTDPGNPAPVNRASDLAYVIYTSGSTGKPKGVMVEHRGMSNLQTYFRQQLQVTSQDKILQFASFSFDASVWETYMALFNGAELHVPTADTLHHYGKLAQYLDERRITIATLPPAYLSGMPPEAGGRLRIVITAGSASTVELTERWRNKVTYINAYGPTETTICATAWTAPDGGGPLDTNTVPIGTPLPNTQAYIVSAYDQLQPIGVIGELCVGGAGLARGYLHRPELTGKQFPDNPFVPGTRMYRTGDLAKWLPDGTIAYAGRKDDQIKIRGFRIEPGEVAQCLSTHPAVFECIVVPVADGQDAYELCAYVGTGEGGTELKQELKPEQLRSFAEGLLPAYMVPAYFVVLETLPLTPNGKVDKRALPEPNRGSQGDYVAPCDDTQNQLSRIWAETLNIERVSVRDSFFALGGHSLKAIAVLTRIQQELGAELSLKEFFQAPTIEEQAARIRAASKETYTDIEEIAVTPAQAYYPLTYGQRRMFVLQQLEGAKTAYHIVGAYRIAGQLDITRVQYAFDALIQRHEALRTSFAVEDGEFVQTIREAEPCDIRFAEIDEEHLEHALRHSITPFDLARPPLLRVSLLKLRSREDNERELPVHVLSIEMHHIVSDGVSGGILMRDFLALYEGRALEPLRVQFKDYAVWQSGSSGQALIEQQERYWLNAMQGWKPRQTLPTDEPRPSAQSFEGAHAKIAVDRLLTEQLKDAARQAGCTLNMVLLAGYMTLLSKYGGEEDLVVGTPSAGRTHSDTQNMIGMFVNMLPIRVRLVGEMTFLELLEAVRDRSLSAIDNQHYPMEQLAEKLELPRDVSRNALFDAAFVMQNFDRTALKAEGLTIATQPFMPPSAKFDLTLEATETDEGVSFSLEYATKLYREATANRMLSDYASLLAQLASRPDARLKDIRLFEPVARTKKVRSAEIEFNF